jgi:hypothetical protein
MEPGRVFGPEQVHGGPVLGGHQLRQGGEVVLQAGQPGPGARGEDQVVGTGERPVHREPRVQVTGHPAETLLDNILRKL